MGLTNHKVPGKPYHKVEICESRGGRSEMQVLHQQEASCLLFLGGITHVYKVASKIHTFTEFLRMVSPKICKDMTHRVTH
jgi:hypothetical protein